MTVSKIKENNFFNSYHQEFLIDSGDEITTLESTYKCNFGDRAYLPNGNYYTRHSDGYSGDLWEVVEKNGSSSSGSEEENSEENNLFIITFTPDGQGSATLDKTWNEIKEAYDNGKILKAFYESGGGPDNFAGQFLELSFANISRETNKLNSSLQFTGTDYNDYTGKIDFRGLHINNNNNELQVIFNIGSISLTST